MAYTKIVLENPKTGEIRSAPVGLSWTVLFFGFFPPLLRRDWKWATVILVSTFLTMGLSSFVFMVVYNKLYIKELIASGFEVKSVESGTIEEISRKIGLKLPALKAKINLF